MYAIRYTHKHAHAHVQDHKLKLRESTTFKYDSTHMYNDTQAHPIETVSANLT